MTDDAHAEAALRVKIERELLAVGCNGVCGAADWTTGALAYAGGPLVAVADAHAQEVLCTLHGHTKRVNCVKWVRAPADAPSVLLSGASDGLLLAHVQTRASTSPWHTLVLCELTGEGEGITAVDGEVYAQGGGELRARVAVATTGRRVVMLETTFTSDCTQSAVQSQRVYTAAPRHTCECLRFASVGAVPAVLLAGCVDGAIRVLAARDETSLSCCAAIRGHEDSVRSIDVQCTPQPDRSSSASPAPARAREVVVASASQDAAVRVWRLCEGDVASGAAAAAALERSGLGSGAPRHVFHVPEQGSNATSAGEHSSSLAMEVVSVLRVHEDWVLGVAFVGHGPDALLASASMDQTVALYRASATTHDSGMHTAHTWELWSRLGDVGGAESHGFFGVTASACGSRILAYSSSGGLHLWELQEGDRWVPRGACGGARRVASSIAWEPVSASYLASCSEDQTVRIFAPVCPEAARGSGGEGARRRWTELARPLTHGYDMRALVALPRPRHRILACADEKVGRILDGTAGFVEALERAGAGSGRTAEDTERAHAAAVPPLGLSNRAVSSAARPVAAAASSDTSTGMQGSATPDDPEDGSAEVPAWLPISAPAGDAFPPTEDILASRTLWVETRKLYAHGNDLTACGAAANGKFVLTACRGRKEEDCSVVVWRTDTWERVGVLAGHRLDVTRVAVSTTSRSVATTGRDRQLCLFVDHAASDSDVPDFRIVARVSAHKREVRDVCFVGGDDLLLTAGRDHTVTLWDCALLRSSGAPALRRKFAGAAPAALSVRAAPRPACASAANVREYWVAIAFESGDIQVDALEVGHESAAATWRALAAVPRHLAPSMRATQLLWSPDALPRCCLAASSEDHSVRIWNVVQHTADNTDDSKSAGV